jgi:lipoprotein-anchoring transpeptidase ErfK/SrfK
LLLGKISATIKLYQYAYDIRRYVLKQKHLKKILFLLPMALLFAVLFAFSPSLTGSASAADATWTGVTTGPANVRTGTTASASVVTTYATGTRVTVYATVQGQNVWGTTPNWYRISSLSSAPRYIYAGLISKVTTTTQPTPTPAPGGSSWAGVTTGSANVRTGPTTSSSVVATYATGTSVTVYATVQGENVWGTTPNWYRISSLSSAPRYIYAGLVVKAGSNPSPNTSSKGKVIVVNTTKQWLYAYQDGKQVFNTAVTTGRPELYTPLGNYKVLSKVSPTTFYSPWPPGSPYYYEPTHINYALLFDYRGLYIHDAWWRAAFGPGTNTWHNDPKAGWVTGSHGCVNTALDAAKWIYNWAPVGTVVQIVA